MNDELERIEQMKTNDKVIFYLDIDSIQDFIFSTNRLRLIAGGSILLDRINRQDTVKLLEQHGFGNDPRNHSDFILSSGGQTKVLFADRDRAERFGLELSRRYREIGTQVTYICEEVNSGDEQQALAQAETAMASRKYQKDEPCAIAAAPFFKYCRECGREPAAALVELPGNSGSERKTIELCTTCLGKWQAGTNKVPLFGNYTFNHEIAKITGSGDEGFVTLVALDGNAMGKKISRLSTFADLKNFSKTTEKILRDSLLTTITQPKFFPPNSGNEIKGFRPLICGGDDIMFLCRAGEALQFTLELIETISQESEQSDIDVYRDSPLQMSAGVLFMKQKYPFAIAARLAASLLSSAKMKSRRHNNAAAIDYHVVGSGATDNIRDLRRQEGYERLDLDGSTYELSRRPYTAGELKDLMDKGRKLQGTLGSRSRPESLRQHFNQGRDYAIIKMYQAANRLDDKPGREFRREFIDNGNLWQYDDSRDSWSTKLLDIIELAGLRGRER
ncbi:MAG: hypothetical protein DRH04_00275 [Deltaproteobacteria bacterium]|nr:MAG: hypothetical protein DRH04_00275 [Deltaproteobacteria bacterium]